MNKLKQMWPVILVIGLFLMASFSINEVGFHSGIMGIIGSVLVILALWLKMARQIKNGDQHSWRVLKLVLGLLLFIILLNIIEVSLSK